MKVERDPDRPGTWRVDVRVARRRIRERGFKTKKAAEDFVVELRSQAKRSKFGLEVDRPRVTVAELVLEHGSEIDETRPRGRQLKRIIGVVFVVASGGPRAR